MNDLGQTDEKGTVVRPYALPGSTENTTGAHREHIEGTGNYEGTHRELGGRGEEEASWQKRAHLASREIHHSTPNLLGRCER